MESVLGVSQEFCEDWRMILDAMGKGTKSVSPATDGPVGGLCAAAAVEAGSGHLWAPPWLPIWSLSGYQGSRARLCVCMNPQAPFIGLPHTGLSALGDFVCVCALAIQGAGKQAAFSVSGEREMASQGRDLPRRSVSVGFG